MVFKARILFQVFLFVITFQGLAQVSFESEEELKKAANSFFDASDYAKAKPLFSQLLSKDALNPDYNYRFGVCILFTEPDPLKPLPYIEGGASTKGVNVEAHYFLGKAFQFNYRFDDAIKSYEKGKSQGFSKAGVDLDRCIEECRNGKVLYNPAIDFQPAMDKDVIASEFYRPYDFRKLKGKVIPMPPEFKTKYDEKNLVGTVIYTPTNSQTLIYASYGEDGANAKDLYRVNRLPNGELSLPLRLPNTINTKYDEDYAFYDEESQMLFFASKGHNSMGGYDVFSSKYDANNSTWSTPMNLQYPVNSPYDDFLYVSDPEGKVAFFTTDRNVEAGKLRVMKTLLNDPLQVEVSVLEGTFVDRTDSVYNYAALTVLDPITKEVVGKYRSNKLTGKYLLILSPQNDYTMDVGPREAEGFRFDLDVPKQESVNSLKQEIIYDASAVNGTVTVTNYFSATGGPDTVNFAESRSLKEIEERMVAMPDPSEILASRSQADAKKDAVAAKAKQAEEEAARQAQALALKEKQAVEAAKLAELAALEKSRTDSIREAEKQAFVQAEKEALAKAQQAKEEAARQAEEVALKEKQATEKAAKEELAKAEKAQSDSIREAEKQAFAQAEKEALAKAQQAKEEAARQAEGVALKAEQATEESARLQELANAEKAHFDSIRKPEKQALVQAEQEAAAKSRQIEQEAARQSEALALREKQATDKAAEQAALAKAESEKQFDLVAQTKEKFRKDSISQAEEFEKLRVSHAEAKAKRDSVNKAIELADLKEAEEKAKRDSIAAVELVFEQERKKKLEELNERKDLLTQIKEAEIKRHLADAAAKEKNVEPEIITKEPISEPIVSGPATLPEKKQDPAKEVVAEVPKVDAAKGAESRTEMAEAATTQAPPTAAMELAADTAKKGLVNVPPVTEVLSESELFLETIAKLEAQKKEQDQLVEAENAAQKKALTDQRSAQAEAKRAADTSAVKMQAVGMDGTVASAEERAIADNSDVETVSVALKSDADPQKYLTALDKVEKEIAKDAAANTGKNYELKELPSEPKASKDADPVLQAKIDADRLALAEHQKIAVEKEKALKEQMQRDRATVQLIEQATEDELALIEGEKKDVLPAIEKNAPTEKPEVKAEVVTKAETAVEIERVKEPEVKAAVEVAVNKEEEVAAIEGEKKDILPAIEKKAPTEKPEVKAEVVTKAETAVETERVKEPEVKAAVEVAVNKEDGAISAKDQEVLDALAEFDRILAKNETPDPGVSENIAKDDVAKENVVVNVPKPVIEADKLESVDEVAISAPISEPMKEAAAPVTPDRPASVEKAEVIRSVEAEPLKEVEEVLETASSEKQELLQPKPAATGTVGTIPFLTAAKRNQTITRPSFEKIEDVSMRRMVQRMRAEDIGRMAVLKNMKNEWVDAGKSAESLKGIKENIRNQDVLESVAAAPSREEYIRPPFDRNTLRKRKDVYYKLEFRIVTAGVSQTVSEAMTPEQAISFAMPEFDLQAGHYLTLADATFDLKEYQRRGFESLRIIPFLKKEQVSLSDVSDVPFVD